MYVGTYTNGDSKGIYKLQFNTTTGELSDKQLAVAIENPSFISFSPNKKFIYAVGEGSSGLVTAFNVKADGKLEFINNVSSEGNGPCHVSINTSGNKAVVSNYGGGIMALYNINKDGSLNKADQIFDYNLPEKVSHAHSAQFFKDNLFVADLGINAVYQYKLNTDTNTYTLISSSIVDIPEKSGPRHFALNKRWAFYIHY